MPASASWAAPDRTHDHDHDDWTAVPASLRSVASGCFGLSGTFSVRRDVFGYIWGPMNRSLSVLQHVALVRDQAFNLSVFLVDHEPDFSGEFTLEEAQRMQFAIDVMRELYSQVGVGIRRIYWRYIPTDEAGGYDTVDGAEATDLTEDFSGPNDGIDVFFVTNVTDADGWSTTPGSCDKDSKGRTGAIIQVLGNANILGILLAHEVGHYLGLPHANNITNVMGDDSDGDGVGSIDSTSTNLTNPQGNTMKNHCSIRSSC